MSLSLAMGLTLGVAVMVLGGAGLVLFAAWLAERHRRERSVKAPRHVVVPETYRCRPRESELDRLTREAMDDVDAGRVVDHQAVRAWAESVNRSSTS